MMKAVLNALLYGRSAGRHADWQNRTMLSWKMAGSGYEL